MINQIISHQKSNLFLNFANIKGCRSGTCGVLQRNLRRIHALLMASCSERNLIGWRTESDRAANGNRSGGGRNPMAEGALFGGTLRGCTCLKCTNKADGVISKGGALVSARLCRLPEQEVHQQSSVQIPHRIRGTHRTFWQRKPPTDRHRYAQIRRVWHPCHTHAANNAA